MPSYTTKVSIAAVVPGSVLIPLGVTHVTLNFSSIDTAAVTAIATSVATTIANSIVGNKQDADGTYVLPPPTGTAADDAPLVAALASGRKVVARVGTYGFTSHLIVPNLCDLVGQGGGSTSVAGRTVFKALAAGAQIEIQGGGGYTGGFEIDGNSIATTPFFRNGGTGANARTIHNITYHHNAVSGTHSNDLSLFYGAQNDYYYQCGCGYADRDAMVFDQGFGGVTFERWEITGSIGRYWHRYDNQIAGGVSPVPFNIVWKGTTNLEGGSPSQSVSHVKMNAGVDITYDKSWFYSASGVTGPSVDVGTGCILNLVNPSFQSTPNTKNTGSMAIKVAGTGRVTIFGRAQYLNFDKPINIDGLAARIFDNTPPEFYNCSTPRFTGTSGATFFQWMSQSAGLRTTVPFSDTSPAQAIQAGLNAGQTAFLYELLANGDLNYFPGSGFGSADASWGRIAAGIIGPKPGGGQVFLTATGGGFTASRPTPPAGVVVTYGNSQTGTYDWWDGTQWRSLSAGGGGGVSAVPPRDLPQYAPTAPVPAHMWDPTNSFYYAEPVTLHGGRAAQMKAINGDADLQGAAAGDSVLAGYNGTAYFYENSVSRTIGKQFAKAVGIPFCNGIQMACADTSGKVYDNVTKGGWTANTQYLGSTGSGQTCSFVTLDPATAIDILVFDGVGSGSISWTIDGVAQTAIPIGSTNVVKKVTVTGLANTTHTVQFTSGAANQLLIGWWWRNPNIKQFYMHCLSVGGSAANTNPTGPGKAANWSDLTAPPSAAPYGLGWLMSSTVAALGVTFDMTVISAGGNDMSGGQTAANTDTGIANMLAYSWLGANKSFVKVYKPLASINDTTFDTWSGLCFTRCDLASIAMFDLDHFVNRRTSADADGLLGDDSGFHTHPLVPLMRAIGRMVAKMWATGLYAAPLTQIRVETTGASAAYVPRFSTAIAPAGASVAIGADQPADAVNGDPWFDLP